MQNAQNTPITADSLNQEVSVPHTSRTTHSLRKIVLAHTHARKQTHKF